MVEKKEQIAPELWAPLQAQEKDSEKIEKPSLTFLQDGWRRLKQNKLAMVSMGVIILLVLGAVLIPFFWGYSYEDQTLTLSNTPPILKLYPIQDDKNDICIYITKSYDAMEVTSDGELVQLLKPAYKDVIDRRSVYDLNGEELIIDYSIYTQAMKDYNALEKKYAAEGEVPATAAKYLSKYFGDDAKNTTISLVEAKNILDEKIDKCSVTYAGKILTESKSVWNKTFLLGSDSLGRDLFIRVVYGARMSLTVGIFAALVNFIIGVFYGCFAGYKGGNVDTIMMRIVDVIDSVPVTLYVILIMVVIGSGMQSIILALGLTYWVRMARIVRGQVLSLKNSESCGGENTGCLYGAYFCQASDPQHDGYNHGGNCHADPQRHFHRGVPELYRPWYSGSQSIVGHAVQRCAVQHLCLSLSAAYPCDSDLGDHSGLQSFQRWLEGCL